jgi:hypothetical protein
VERIQGRRKRSSPIQSRHGGASSLRAREQRVPVLESCSFAVSRLIGEHVLSVQQGRALAINACSGGMLLLTSYAPEVEQLLTIQLPTRMAADKRMRVADVRWTRTVSFDPHRTLYLAGVRFLEQHQASVSGTPHQRLLAAKN